MRRSISRKPGPARRGDAVRLQRPAFSLVEIMIAIGILGIGMLMVAATFPVGLDQSRIVSEKSRIPLITDDGFARMEMLLGESIKRFPVSNTAGFPPTQTFRDVVKTLPRTWSNPNMPLVVEMLPVTGANPSPPANDPYWLGNSNPQKPGWLILNDWLGAGFDASRPLFAGIQARYYPSMQRKMSPNQALPSDTPYTWSVLAMRSPPTLPGVAVNAPDYVAFILFVNRLSTATPILIQGLQPSSPPQNNSWYPDYPATPTALKLSTGGGGGTPNYVSRLEYDSTASQPGYYATTHESPSIFDPGGYAVAADGLNAGQIYRIKSVELDGTPRVELEMATPTGSASGLLQVSPPTALWLVPADPLTGHTPCIAVYSRRFPL